MHIEREKVEREIDRERCPISPREKNVKAYKCKYFSVNTIEVFY